MILKIPNLTISASIWKFSVGFRYISETFLPLKTRLPPTPLKL